MIPQYQMILYATDLSENAAHAFRHAIAIARCFGARIQLLHVLPDVDPAVINYVSTVMGEGKLADFEIVHKTEIKDAILKRMHTFAKEELIDHPEDIERIADIEVHHGSPLVEILAAAERINADLIVMGSHSKGALKYAFLGSVAEKVLRKCHRPMLIIPLHD
ncbi:MAG: universal stress protein [Desulfuromonadales bacterium]